MQSYCRIKCAMPQTKTNNATAPSADACPVAELTVVGEGVEAAVTVAVWPFAVETPVLLAATTATLVTVD